MSSEQQKIHVLTKKGRTRKWYQGCSFHIDTEDGCIYILGRMHHRRSVVQVNFHGGESSSGIVRCDQDGAYFTKKRGQYGRPERRVYLTTRLITDIVCDSQTIYTNPNFIPKSSSES